MLDNEIKEQRVMGTVLPAIFLAVAAFLLGRLVLSRLVSTQREQIAALKALGYANGATLPRTTLKMVAAPRLTFWSGWRWGPRWATGWGVAADGVVCGVLSISASVRVNRLAPWRALVGSGR